ncbi:ASCH domain-containing protein [Nanoarchaeota archaeon]
MYKMRLHPDQFNLVALGKKKIEVRVNDEKRQKLCENDTIQFLKRPDEIEEIFVEIIKLSYYKSFSEVFNKFPNDELGIDIKMSEKDYIAHQRQYYNEDEEKKYGVVVIHTKLI